MPGIGKNKVLWVGEQWWAKKAPPQPQPQPQDLQHQPQHLSQHLQNDTHAPQHLEHDTSGQHLEHDTPGQHLEHETHAPQHLEHLPQHLQHDTHAHAHTRMCTHTHTRTRTAWGKCPPGFEQEWLKYLFWGSGVTQGYVSYLWNLGTGMDPVKYGTLIIYNINMLGVSTPPALPSPYAQYFFISCQRCSATYPNDQGCDLLVWLWVCELERRE